MVKVKINGKTYNVGELGFSHYTYIEEQGCSIVEAFNKKQFMLMAMGFTCVACECDRAEAEKIIQQHVLGGGSVLDIVSAFEKAISQSDFFQRMLGMKVETTEDPKQEKKAKTDQES